MGERLGTGDHIGHQPLCQTADFAGADPTYREAQHVTGLNSASHDGRNGRTAAGAEGL